MQIIDKHKLEARLARSLAIALRRASLEAFRTKSWNGKKWKPALRKRGNGSLLINTATLRNTLHFETMGNEVTVVSPTPYANIHNGGGRIAVTPRMKRYFWAKHLQAKQAKNTDDASFWLAMALSRNAYLDIPQRRFVGNTKQVEDALQKAFREQVAKLPILDAIKQHIDNT